MKPAKPVPPSSRPRPNHHRPRGASALKPANRFRVLYIVVSALVICSFIAVALTTIDFGSLFGEDDVDDTLNPNADLISEQETVVARNPDDVDAVTMLANLLGQTGSIAKAIPLYERALELAPGDTSIRLDFASSLAGAGYLADAESQFRLVLEADPENQTAHYYLAELYMQTDPPRLDEARQHYARAAEIDPTSFLAERAEIKLTELGSSSPVASPESTPAG